MFGAAGKLAIEISMIGFLGGTCIAFFVVMGDLAPPIIAGYLGIESSERLRIGVMLGKFFWLPCRKLATDDMKFIVILIY